MTFKNDSRHTKNAALAITKWIGSPNSVIIHTVLFTLATLILALKLFSFEAVMLIWNTLVSLEAIYLSIFIQMSVNTQAAHLIEIQEDIDEIQEDVGEIQEDVVELAAE